MPTPEELLDHEMQLAKLAAELTGSQSYATKMPPSDQPPPASLGYSFDGWYAWQTHAANVDAWATKYTLTPSATDGPPTIADEPPPYVPFDEYHKRRAQKLAASMDEWTAKISEWTTKDPTPTVLDPESKVETPFTWQYEFNDGPPTIEDENESDDPDFQMCDWAGDWPGYEQTWPYEPEQQNAATPRIELLAAADFEELTVSELRDVHNALRDLLCPTEPEPPKPKRRKFDLDPPT